jgi:hypothetical protein
VRNGGARRIIRPDNPFLNHWELPAAAGAFLTLNGSNVSALADRGRGRAHMTQATTGAQPAFNASGGPNGQPCIDLQGTGRSISAGPGSALGQRICHHVVCKLPDTASRVAFQLLSVDEVTDVVLEFKRAAGSSKFSCYSLLDVDGVQSKDATTPAFDTGWHLHSFRPLSTGTLWQIDGTTVGGVTWSGTGGMFPFSHESIGDAQGANSGGSVACVINADDNRYAQVKAYVRSRYGLSIA